MSASLTVDLVEAEVRACARRGSSPRPRSSGARSGCSPRPRAARSAAAPRGWARIALHRGRAEHVAVHAGPGRRARARGRWRRARLAVPATAMPPAPRAADLGRDLGLDDRVDSAARRVDLVRRRRVGVEVALGLAHRAHPRGDVERRACRRAGPPRTRCCRRRCRSPGSACSRRSAPAVAPRKVSRASSSPEIVRTSTPKRSRSTSTNSLAVLGVAHGAGRHGHDLLRTQCRSMISRYSARRRSHALHRLGRQPPGLVHALPETGHSWSAARAPRHARRAPAPRAGGWSSCRGRSRRLAGSSRRAT